MKKSKDDVMISFMGQTYEEAVEVTSMITRIVKSMNMEDFPTEESLETFFEFMNEEMFMNHQDSFGMFILKAVSVKTKKIVGMIAVRKEDNHVCLYFVPKASQGKGIGRKLFNEAVKECKKSNPDVDQMDVHASTFATKIYEKLGFVRDVPKPLEKEGILYLPMTLKFE